jgi:FdhD protein
MMQPKLDQHNAATQTVCAQRYTATEGVTTRETLVIEAPLQISIEHHAQGQPRFSRLALTMRTPGDDGALAAGYLLSEGIIQQPGDITSIHASGPQQDDGQHHEIRVTLSHHLEVDLTAWQRYTYVSASCGICGKTSIDALQKLGCTRMEDSLRVSTSALLAAPIWLRERQSVFGATGGLHAAALFDADGRCLRVREDVGRHNAVDKLVGSYLLEGGIPANRWLLLSGRVSFELVQKAAMANIPLIVAVGAPSSLALEAAAAFNLTLIGFLREQRFNVYHGTHRIIAEQSL